MTPEFAPTPAEGDGMLPLPLSFPLTLRGYDRELVHEYVDELHAEIRVLTVDRDAAVRQAEALTNRLEEVRAAHADLQSRFDRVCRTPADPDAVGSRVRRILDLAQAEAAEILDRARQEAHAVRAEADRARDRILADARSTAQRCLGQADERVRELDRIRAQTVAQLQAVDRVLTQAEQILADDETPDENSHLPTPSRTRTAA
jgi:cell division septum initiation protein DivIVA